MKIRVYGNDLDHKKVRRAVTNRFDGCDIEFESGVIYNQMVVKIFQRHDEIRDFIIAFCLGADIRCEVVK